MKKFLVIFFMAFAIKVNAQIPKRSCWDYNCGRTKESYYVNQRGEKNGPYKSFDADGVLAIETNFKNGYTDGIYKEYFNNGGRAELVSSETYKEGILNGPAIYYGGEKHSWVVKKGNYTNGEPDGFWTYIEQMIHDYDMPEGFKYYSGTTTFKNGEVYSRSPINYFYPSGKIFFEEIKRDSSFETREYHPSGKVAIRTIMDKSGVFKSDTRYDSDGILKEENIHSFEGKIKIIIQKKYWPNGQLKEFTTRKLSSPEVNLYEGYNQDGTKNETMIYNERKKEELRLEVELDLQIQKKQCAQTLRKADSLFNLNQVYYLKNASYFYENLAKDYVLGARNFRKDSSNMDYYAEVTKHADERRIAIKKILEADELEKIEYDFNELNYPSKLEKIDMLYDVGNKKTKREVSSWGVPSEFVSNVGKKRKIYHAFELLYQESVEKMNAAKNMSEKRIVMKDRIKLLNRIIELADMETPEMEKALKKEEDIGKIKVILGL